MQTDLHNKFKNQNHRKFTQNGSEHLKMSVHIVVNERFYYPHISLFRVHFLTKMTTRVRFFRVRLDLHSEFLPSKSPGISRAILISRLRRFINNTWPYYLN